MKNSTAVVILSFDGYSDLWDTSISLLNRYWDDNKYPIYLVTNKKLPKYQGITVINVGEEVSWSRRARDAMSMVKEEYIILLLEDYFVGKKVNSQHIEDLLEYTRGNDLDYLRIVPVPKTKYKNSTLNGIHSMRQDRPYGINLQAAIWKKSYFIKTLAGGDYNAWEYEKRQKTDSPDRVNGKCEVLDYYAIEILNGVIQGKWYINTLNYFEKKDIKIELGKREVMNYKEVFVMEVRKYLLRVVPVGFQKWMKPILKKIGFKFVT